MKIPRSIIVRDRRPGKPQSADPAEHRIADVDLQDAGDSVDGA